MVYERSRALVLGVVCLAAGCGETPEEVATDYGSATVDGDSTRGLGGSTGVGSSTEPGSGSGAATDGCSEEVCNGVDDDCDGDVDEGCSCVDGETEDCFEGDAAVLGVGVCTGGTRTCAGGSWGECIGQMLPGEEVCNGLDDDCDGTDDEELAPLSCGEGICMAMVEACVKGMPQECVPGTPQDEICNGMDDDCDGDVDEITCNCLDGAMQGCYSGPVGTEGVGECIGGTQVCMGGSYGACMGDQTPVAELCFNGMDEDCDGTPDDGCCTQVVLDGGFEAGTPNPNWNEASTTFGTPLCTVMGCGGTGPRSGNWWVWFGGIDGEDLASVTQDLLIPSGTATLSFWLEIPQCAGVLSDSLTVEIDGMTVLSYDNADPACDMTGYAEQTVDVSAFADGGVHTLSFVGQVFGLGPPMSSITNFFVDDVMLEVCIP